MGGEEADTASQTYPQTEPFSFLGVPLNKDLPKVFVSYVCTFLIAGPVYDSLGFTSPVASSMPCTCRKINKCLLNEYLVVIILTSSS